MYYSPDLVCITVANSNVPREGKRDRKEMLKSMFDETTLCAMCDKLEKAARGTGKCVTLDIIQNKGQVSSQADRRGPHVQTMPGVNIHYDICAVCYFHRLNCSRLTFSSKSHWLWFLHFKSIWNTKYTGDTHNEWEHGTVDCKAFMMFLQSNYGLRNFHRGDLTALWHSLILRVWG